MKFSSKLGIFTLVAFAVLLAWATNTPQPIKVVQKLNAVDIAKNTQALNDCLKDKPGCLGGYIKWSDGPVVRIANTTGINSNLEIGLDSIEIKMSIKEPWLPSAIEYIARPDDPIWDAANKAYGRQFFQRK